MTLHRDHDGPEPLRAQPIEHLDLRREARGWTLGTGTLACPDCDAPVAVLDGPIAPADPLACPYCGHAAPVRDFLSLAAPARPARVEVRVVHPAAWPTTRTSPSGSGS